MTHIQVRPLLIFGAFLIAYLTACRKSDSQTPSKGEIFEKGEPYGAIITKAIGSAGGHLQSADSMLKLTIPAGALTANTEISIQAVQNTNPAGTGVSYRIAPDLSFQKPVTITMSFDGMEDSLGLFSCLLGMALQDSSGVWQMKTSCTVNEVNKTISVESIQTGDWCMMLPIRLIPLESTVKPGQEVPLQVIGFIPVSIQDPCDIWPGGEFPHADVPVHSGTVVPSSMIEKWELLATGRGVGTLHPDGGRAVYKPSSIDNPDMNPASIAVRLKYVPRPMLTRVYVVPSEEYIILNINARSYTYKDVSVFADDNGSHQFGITWKYMLGSDDIGAITWEGQAEGSHAWDETGNQFWFEPRDLEEGAFYNSFVGDLDQRPSSGSLTIDKFGGPDEFVTGSFILVNAGLRLPDDIYLGPHKITGKFKIRRED